MKSRQAWAWAWTGFFRFLLLAVFALSASLASGENLFNINTFDSIYGSYNETLTGNVSSGSPSTISWQSAGYHWTGSIGLTNTQGQILALITTNANDVYVLSTKGATAMFGKPCAGNATECVVLTPGQTQSLYGAINAANNGRGICCTTSSSVQLLSAADIYSLLGPSVADTLAALRLNQMNLNNVFALFSSYLNPGLSYDCALFDKHGMCVSVSGRYSAVDGTDTQVTSGVVTMAYRLKPNARIGAFVDQFAGNINSGGVNVNGNTPDVGLFAVWTQYDSGAGLNLRAAFRYGLHDTGISRMAIGSSEPGFGMTTLTDQGVQLTASEGYDVRKNLMLKPYVGLRYINLTLNGYTEYASTSVTTPLAYNAVRDQFTTLLGGISLIDHLTHKVDLSGTLGVETDLSESMGVYTASGIPGLTPIPMNGNYLRTRGVASAGASYDLGNSQLISAQLVYRQEAMYLSTTTTALVSYVKGF